MPRNDGRCKLPVFRAESGRLVGLHTTSVPCLLLCAAGAGEDVGIITGVCHTANSIFKRYRDQYRSNALVNELVETQVGAGAAAPLGRRLVQDLASRGVDGLAGSGTSRCSQSCTWCTSLARQQHVPQPIFVEAHTHNWSRWQRLCNGASVCQGCVLAAGCVVSVC